MSSTEQHSYDEVAPDASAMIESMRAYGYTLPTAIADLIDNSIAAGCTTVWLDSWWSGEKSWISITDDGQGMSEDELRNAMRLGSRNPRDERAPSDLGRFGLGLKTASLSQCRRLTVFTRADGGDTHIRRWDLDHLAQSHVSGWQLLRTRHPDSVASLERFESLHEGTTVLWEELDRIVHDAGVDDERLRSHFLKSIDDVEQHLAMVFHRYLGRRRTGLRILVNDHEVSAWDPFAENHPATTPTPDEMVYLPGHAQPISVKGYVLPHKDKLGPEGHKKASGPAGWNAQQGFYLYRNERLIVAGSWLGLGGRRPWTKEEHYKLARIQLDIPNSMDHLWHLDVKKSHATPPPQIRERLRGLAQKVRQDARGVFAHRGRYGKRTKKRDYARPWKPRKRAGRMVYSIDREHPLVAAVLSAADTSLSKPLDAMLRIIEETVPIEQIWLDAAEHPDDAAAPFHGTTSKARRSVLVTFYETIRRIRGTSHLETIELLQNCEEFADDEAQAIISTLVEDARP